MSKNTNATSPQSAQANPNYTLTKAHADLIIEELPEPPGTFYTDDLDEWCQSTVQSLYRRDLIVLEGVDVIQPGQDSHDYKANRYRVKRPVYEDAKDIVESRDSILPCGHSGFSNQGDKLSCSYEGCHQEFDRNRL
jgi:hypothetical protein